MTARNEQPSKHSLNFKFTAESKSRANVLYNSLRVDSEPGQVIRELSVDENVLNINLMSSSVSNLRACINGILENIKTLTEVIETFEITPDYNYDYL